MIEFYIVNLDKSQYIDPVDCSISAEIMEHSWQNLYLMGAIDYLLSPKGEWYCTRVVWASSNASIFTACDSPYFIASQYYEKIVPEHAKWFRYVINHTKKQYIDKRFIPFNPWGFQLHPLPFMVVDNKRALFKSFPVDSIGTEYVGLWCGDIISTSNKIPRGYEEIVPCFRDKLIIEKEGVLKKIWHIVRML